jgi:hypothetical protein
MKQAIDSARVCFFVNMALSSVPGSLTRFSSASVPPRRLPAAAPVGQWVMDHPREVALAIDTGTGAAPVPVTTMIVSRSVLASRATTKSEKFTPTMCAGSRWDS